MNKKEKEEATRLCSYLDVLFDIVIKLEYYCHSRDKVFFASLERTGQCKKVLLKYLNKIQKSVDKLLGIDVYVKPCKIFKNKNSAKP